MPVRVRPRAPLNNFVTDNLIQERKHLLDNFIVSDDPMSYLMTIDVNPTELCNRTCEFCPRVDSEKYPNQNLHMSSSTAHVLADHLRDINYSNQIHFGGQGEPLLTKNFENIVRTLKQAIPYNQYFHLTTNGDHLTKQRLDQLIDAGINHINISCYDGPDQAQGFVEMLAGQISHTVKHFYHTATVNWGLPAVSNRAGVLKAVEQVKHKACHLPFYSTSIDWNGNVYLCVHDWNKHKIFGNIHYRHLRDIWLSDDLNTYRSMLIQRQRHSNPCHGCDVEGDYYGARNIKFFANKLNEKI